ncbi:MAG: FAD-dependent oxidoreductase, partial [Proteobacteria bacterium]|nr:FAD-dependent oxidoreductase [Pseudomonadota bacterium]
MNPGDLFGNNSHPDCVIIGGGIHGLGVAHDLGSRGITNTWLFEKNTFASGTSTWSTKLIHGGLRYLENISEWGLVRSSLMERERLSKLASDIIKPL